MTIVAEEMRDKLIPLDRVREILARTEPLSEVQFFTGDQIRFRLDPDWIVGLPKMDDSELVKAYATINGTEYQLTKEAALGATSMVGFPKTFTARTPAKIIEPGLNWYFSEEAGREVKLLATEDHGLAFTRATVTPFSNLALLDQLQAGLEAKYPGVEIRADYKLAHSLRKTHLRLVVPEEARRIRPDDPWSLGIQMKNSLIGEIPTVLDGYAFQWICTNGMINTHATSGKYRRSRGGGDQSEAYEWARAAVDEVLGGLEGTLETVARLDEHELEDRGQALREVFELYQVPADTREDVIRRFAGGEGGEAGRTMYDLVAAITAAANDSGLRPEAVERLMTIGGDIPHAHSHRCGECRRILPN